jgi:hypothetical protein
MPDDRDLAEALSELAGEIQSYLATPTRGYLQRIQDRAAALLLTTDAAAAAQVHAAVSAEPRRFVGHTGEGYKQRKPAARAMAVDGDMVDRRARYAAGDWG